ncbi:P-loop NTPase [bacterium]|nr:P-loop NTPase [bacterium]
MQQSDPFARLKQMASADAAARGRVIAIASGKGGVGKSNIALNVAMDLCSRGRRVTLFDADTRLSNIDILVGREPRHSIMDVIYGRRTMADITQVDESALRWISVGAIEHDFQEWEESVKERFFHEIFKLKFSNDFVFIDTSAGLTETMVDFSVRADEVLVITTPEPTAISDAYALVKILGERRENIKIKTIINQVVSEEEAREVFERFNLVIERFLQIKPGFGGYVIDDRQLKEAVKQQIPLMRAYPDCDAAQSMHRIAGEL